MAAFTQIGTQADHNINRSTRHTVSRSINGLSILPGVAR
jgi:hypothetical protein